MSDPRRQVPRTDTLLADPQLTAAGERLGRGLVKGAVQRVQQRIRDGEVAPPDAVELDLGTGRRGPRGEAAIAALLAAVPAAESAIVVNNCAAALALVATA